MTRTHCISNAASDRLRGLPGAFCPGVAPWIRLSVISFKTTRGLVCMSPRALWWNDFVFPAAASRLAKTQGAPLRPTTMGWPSLSPSKRMYFPDGASRPEESRHGSRAVSCRTGGTSILFGDVDCSGPGTPDRLWRDSPRCHQSWFGEWRNLRRSDVRVVAEKNGQATVATDLPLYMSRTMSNDNVYYT